MVTYESIKDFERTIQALKELANDAVYGRLFELRIGESNFFHPDEHRMTDLAKTMEPDLEMADLIDDRSCLNLPENLDTRLNDTLSIIKDTFFTMGMFVGACVADRSGQALEDLSRAWVRAMLAQPRYRDIEPIKRSPRKGRNE